MALFNILRWPVRTLFSICSLLIIAPMIFPLLTLFYIWTLIVDILLKCQYGTSATRITGMSALFKQSTPEKPAVMYTVAFRLSGEMNVNKIRIELSQLLLRTNECSNRRLYGRLMQVMDKAFGFTFWKDARNFNIDQHIKIVQLEDLIKQCIDGELFQNNKPSDEDYINELNKLNDKENVANWKILMRICLKEYGMKTIDDNLPPWQFILLKESKARYTIMMRVHHAIADGIYLARLLCEELLNERFQDVTKCSFSKPSKPVRFLTSVWGIILLPLSLFQSLTFEVEENALHGPKLSGQKQYYLSNPISFDALRNIRKRTNSTINCIILACMSAAYSLHCNRRFNNVYDIGVCFSIPLQNFTKPIVLTNKFAIVTLRVPTPLPLSSSDSVCPESINSANATCTSLKRLKIMKSLIEAAEKDPTHMSIYYLTKIACSVFPSSAIGFLLPQKQVTALFSNVPGPQKPIYYDGDPVENIMFWPHNTPGIGIAMTILSYNGELKVGLAIDEVLLQEVYEGELILRDFENEVQNILHELANQEISSKNLESEEEALMKNP